MPAYDSLGLDDAQRNGLGPRLRRLIEDMREEWQSIDQRIKGYDDELAERVRNEDAATRLIRIPGIGVLTAMLSLAGGAHDLEFGHAVARFRAKSCFPQPSDGRMTQNITPLF
jgi:transposase